MQAHHKRGGQPLFFLYQTRGTYALRGFINLEKLCMLICFDTESKNKSIKSYYISIYSVLFYSKFFFLLYSTFPDSRLCPHKLDSLNLCRFLYIQSFCCDNNSIYFSCNNFKKVHSPETQLYSYFSRFVKSSIYQKKGVSVKM